MNGSYCFCFVWIKKELMKKLTDNTIKIIDKHTVNNEIAYMRHETAYCFSSRELKAQVSFSDQNVSSVVNFHFLSSPLEPTGQFQPNLAQSFLV